MGFLNPKQNDDEDEALPGATGLHLDLDLKRCPACRRELTPWQERCPDCGEVGVAASQVPAASFTLPDLSHLDEDEHHDGDGEEQDPRAPVEDGATPDDHDGDASAT